MKEPDEKGIIRSKIGVLGGTFNPIHFGHLRLALELKQHLDLAQMRLMPCHHPVHRAEPQVNSAERAEMIRLALANCTELTLDERELRREQPSFTVDTLVDLRRELGNEISLSWAIGTDAFAYLNKWYRWEDILSYAHIIVIERPGFSLPEQGPVADFLHAHRGELSGLNESACGSIVVPELRLLSISATDIRDQISQGHSPQFLLPETVCQYIASKKLYR